MTHDYYTSVYLQGLRRPLQRSQFLVQDVETRIVAMEQSFSRLTPMPICLAVLRLESFHDDLVFKACR